MATHIAFLRAINVGGRGLVKMTDLRAVFARAGGRDVRTYINSGNVIFDAAPAGATAVTTKAGAALRALRGREPDILLRSLRQLAAMADDCPFAGRSGDGETKLYVAFLAAAPRAKTALPLLSDKEGLEVVAVRGRDAFIVSRRKRNGMFGFPNGFIEDAFEVRATTRNWTTVLKLLEG